MRHKLVLTLSWMLLASADFAQAQQIAARRSDVAMRFASSVPSRPAVAPRAVAQRTYNAPLQISRLLDLDLEHRSPAEGWDRQDAAYALWRSGSNAMDDGDFRRASEKFHQIHEAYPRSTYAAESWYWEAFSLYRVGGYQNIVKAVAHLDTQRVSYPRTPTGSDARVLATRLRGELALSGDREARRELAAIIQDDNECSQTAVNVKIAALNAYRQIDPVVTVAYLRNLFDRTESCTSYLRQQSVFILAQLHSPEASDILIDLARRSRDLEVRVEAVQWLADLRDDRTMNVLEGILRGEASYRVKETALFSLSQLASPANAGIFRYVATARSTPVPLRVQAVRWLGEQRIQDHSSWLLRLYDADRNPAIREAVVDAVAGQQNVADRSWLLTVARDSTAAIGVRRQAISAAAQLLAPTADLYALYHQVELVPLREQIIDLLGRNREKNAIERLIDIAVLDADSTLRTSSLKWLRQSKDPKAVEFMIAYKERYQ